MTGSRTEPALPTVSGFAARQAIAALRKRGVSSAPILRRAGLPERDLAAGAGGPTDHRVSATAQAKFINFAAEAADDSAFGLHLAEQADPRDAGIFFYIASGANNFGGALALFERYFRIVNEAVRFKLRKTTEGLAVEVEFVNVPRHLVRQNAEFGISVILKALRTMAGRNIHPIRAGFVHGRNSDLRDFERFYGCAVEFARAVSEGATSDLLEFSNDALALPLVTTDAKLIEALQPFCDLAARERRTAAGTLRAAVETEAERLLPHGQATAQTVAKVFAVSVRTLSRRLACEGTTFAEVVDQLRRSLALQYVKDPGMSLSQIAWLLGYEGSTSFSHAFRRWMGRSPSAVRNERRLSPPSA
jgi:AraC-like DNA-binding protein